MKRKSIAEGLKEMRQNAKMSVKEISKILTDKGYRASEKTIYSWESGRSEPSPEVLLNMCTAYHVDDVLLAFGYDGYNEDGTLSLNMYEIDIIEKYRTLDTHGKEMVDFTLDKEYERCAELKTQRPDINKQRYAVSELNAAHERTDIKITNEMKQYDDDIMDDDDF